MSMRAAYGRLRKPVMICSANIACFHEQDFLRLLRSVKAGNDGKDTRGPDRHRQAFEANALHGAPASSPSLARPLVSPVCASCHVPVDPGGRMGAPAWRSAAPHNPGCCPYLSAIVLIRGSRQTIADCHSGSVGPVKKQRISHLELLLHGITATSGSGTTPSDGA